MHYIALGILLLFVFLIFNHMIVLDDKNAKQALIERIKDGKVKFVWIDSLMAEVLEYIDDRLILVRFVNPDDNGAIVYCNPYYIRGEVPLNTFDRFAVVSENSQGELF